MPEFIMIVIQDENVIVFELDTYDQVLSQINILRRAIIKIPVTIHVRSRMSRLYQIDLKLPIDK